MPVYGPMPVHGWGRALTGAGDRRGEPLRKSPFDRNVLAGRDAVPQERAPLG